MRSICTLGGREGATLQYYVFIGAADERRRRQGERGTGSSGRGGGRGGGSRGSLGVLGKKGVFWKAEGGRGKFNIKSGMSKMVKVW